jgi:hypothetical protein
MPGIQARKARGCDQAFTAPKEIRIEGKLPGVGKDSVDVRVASIVPFLSVSKRLVDQGETSQREAFCENMSDKLCNS